MLTSSSAAAMSSSDVSNGSPACGLRMSWPFLDAMHGRAARCVIVHNIGIVSTRGRRGVQCARSSSMGHARSRWRRARRRPARRRRRRGGRRGHRDLRVGPALLRRGHPGGRRAFSVGHEFVGTVAEVGPEVRRFRPGDRVLTASVAGCGHCDGCATGDPVTCVEGPKVFGVGDAGRRAGVGGGGAVGRLPAARHPRGDGRRVGAAAHRQPRHRLDRRQAGRHPPRGHGGRARPRCRRTVRRAFGARPRARAGCSPPTRWPVVAPWRPTRGRCPSRGRRWRPSWRPPAGGAPTRSSTPWPSTPRSTTP